MNHKFKKKYGQNFLRNDKILNNIIDSFEVKDNSLILEVGPGDGALTKKLINKGSNVICFEIDDSLKEYLDKICVDNLEVIYNDFLNINIKDYTKNYDNIYVIANIPYYITTPIITKFIEESVIPEVMILMVQKEVGLRLSAIPGNREYGSISAILNYFFDIEYLYDVDRNSFYPIPGVDSALIKLKRKKHIIPVKNFKKLEKLIYDSFQYKRKNLKNNLKSYDLNIIEDVLKKYNKDLNCRAEELGIEIFCDIVNSI